MRKNVNIQVFSSCNCNCSFCHFKDSRGLKINPQFVKEYLNNNPDINYIVLTGGEPTFAIEECSEIIKGIDKTIKTVILQSNGWWGDNLKVKEIIKDALPSVVHISVDSEKQKIIPLETVIKAVKFLEENSIKTFVVNHTSNDKEYEKYKKSFPSLKRGSILYDDGTSLYSCGPALLANNTVGILDIKGWRGING